ncbi:hypothetical protein JCM1840_007145, partial [Sporobolomyces johnsonii]
IKGLFDCYGQLTKMPSTLGSLLYRIHAVIHSKRYEWAT